MTLAVAVHVGRWCPDSLRAAVADDFVFCCPAGGCGTTHRGLAVRECQDGAACGQEVPTLKEDRRRLFRRHFPW
jgi:hypothetical protein